MSYPGFIAMTLSGKCSKMCGAVSVHLHQEIYFTSVDFQSALSHLMEHIARTNPWVFKEELCAFRSQIKIYEYHLHKDGDPCSYLQRDQPHGGRTR